MTNRKFPLSKFLTDRKLVVIPNYAPIEKYDLRYAQGTTAGGTEVHIFGSVDSFEEGASVFFDLSNTCPQTEGTTIPVESIEFIDSSHLKVVTARSYEGPVSIKVDNPTKEDICQTGAYTYKTLAFTSNQVTQDITVIDTVLNEPFEINSSIPLDPTTTTPLAAVLNKGTKPGRELLSINYHGRLDFIDGSNLKFLQRINLFHPNIDIYSPRMGAVDIDVDSSGSYGYIANPIFCGDLPETPPPGGITIIDISGRQIIDLDSNASTTTPCAPEGITRISTDPLYPNSLKVVGLNKEINDFIAGEKYPGEYLFISGTYSRIFSECNPGEACLIRYPPTRMGIKVIDINPYKCMTTPCSNDQLEPNPDKWTEVAFIGDGTNPEHHIYSIQGLDFAVTGEDSASVYLINPYEGYAYIVDYIRDSETGQVSFELRPDPTNPDTFFKIPLGTSPTDVKVQKVLENTYAYITNAGDDSVTVIDTATNIELPYPQSPIIQDFCYDLDHYPTSFDTRSIGDRGYSSDFHSNTVSVFNLPMSQMNEPVCKIDVGGAPIRMVVQPVPTYDDIFGIIKNALSFASPSDFTTPSKQGNLIKDWERVQELQETGANSQAVLSNIDNFKRNVEKWIVDNELKENINDNVDLYRAGYILDHPEARQ